MSFRSVATALLMVAGLLVAAGPAQAQTSGVYGLLPAGDTTLALTGIPGNDDVRVEAWVRDAEQVWAQEGDSDGYFQLRNVSSKHCLAVPNADPESEVVHYGCNAAWTDQWWRWINTPSGHQLQNKATKLVLAPAGLEAGSPVVQVFPGHPHARLVTD